LMKGFSSSSLHTMRKS